MLSPFALPPHPLAQKAALQVINKVHAYMRANPASELHQCGKMFGVLVTNGKGTTPDGLNYLAAFSAKLDGSYYHEGFVPPVYDMPAPPIGTTKAESQRLQQLLFKQYKFLNGRGEEKDLPDIFRNEKTIIPAEEWFSKSRNNNLLPPSGAGECCAPKLLNYALRSGLEPFAMAEFWVGASPQNELRREGSFYTPCSGRCVPILRHMLQGINVEPEPARTAAEELCRRIDILYEDRWLMVVNKPAGLLSVPGKGEQVSLIQYMSQQKQSVFLQAAHRLDQDTSGLLVLAKTPETYKTLQAYFQRRDILKRYEAVVEEGTKAIPNEGIIDLPLLPNPLDRPRQMIDRMHGKVAITRYCVRERRPNGLVLMDLFPLTGRTHQLRVHTAHPEGLNAPIKGDRLYGTPGERLMLHAAEICFTHPVTKEEMHFCIPSCF